MNLNEFENYTLAERSYPLQVEVYGLNPFKLRRIMQHVNDHITSNNLFIFMTGYGDMFKSIRQELIQRTAELLTINPDDPILQHSYTLCSTSNRKKLMRSYDCVVLFQHERHPKYPLIRPVLENAVKHSSLHRPLIIVTVRQKPNTN